MNSRQFLAFVFLIISIQSFVLVAQAYKSSEECRSEVSKGIYPVCTAFSFYTDCLSEGVMKIYRDGENSTLLCSARYPIEIVVAFTEKIITDRSLVFPEFERSVGDISKPETYVYHIRIPQGFNMDYMKSFTIRSVNATSISTSFLHGNVEHTSREFRDVIPVTQELVDLPCPNIGQPENFPNGVHRIQPNSNSVGDVAKVQLIDILSKREVKHFYCWNEKEVREIQESYPLNNIPVDNKQVLFDSINGFRFNISNWPSNDYLGSYYCTRGIIDNETCYSIAAPFDNFTLINWRGSFGIPDNDDIYISTIARTVGISFECVSTNEIAFQSSINHGWLSYSTTSFIKNPYSAQSSLFRLVYQLSMSDWRNSGGTAEGIVRCIEPGSQKLVRAWRVRVRDVRFQDSSFTTLSHSNLNVSLHFWLASDAAQASCKTRTNTSAVDVKHLPCRNVMECEMVKFCFDQDAECRDVISKQCETDEACELFSPPDTGILNCRLDVGNIRLSETVVYFKGFDGLIYADWTEAPTSALIQLDIDTLGKSTVYPKDWIKSSCKGHRMLTGGLIQWAWQFRNNSWSHIQGFEKNNSNVIVKSDNLVDGIQSTLNITLSSYDIVGITCMVPVWNSDKWLNLSHELHVIEPRKPKIITDGSYKTFKIGSLDQSLPCDVVSYPVSKLKWTKLGYNATNHSTVFPKDNSASLQFPVISSRDAGDYVCVASNIAGNDSKIFHVSIDEGIQWGWLYASFTIVLIIMSISCLSLVVWFRRKFHIAKRADAETQIKEAINKFINGYDDEDSNADKHPYNNEYEIPMDSVTIDRMTVLGSGAFGVVYRGRMESRAGTVAIKTLQQMPRYNAEHFQSLMSELKLLIFIGKHPNIVELVGAITVKIHSGEFYIVSEECTLGSLQNYLRSRRHNMDLTSESSVKYVDLTNDDWKVEQEKEHLEHLMKWSHQIADAMEFISAKNVIHADLATRNILLTAELEAKLTDFGLSRKLYNYVQYVKKKKEPLPWAWMAIEALRDLAFSYKSDVWSYGVVLWELYSFSAVPFGGMNWHPGFVQELKDGLRLSKPESATDAIYELMQSCWNNEPGKRPDFLSLKTCLENMKQNLNSSKSVKETSGPNIVDRYVNA